MRRRHQPRVKEFTRVVIMLMLVVGIGGAVLMGVMKDAMADAQSRSNDEQWCRTKYPSAPEQEIRQCVQDLDPSHRTYTHKCALCT